MVVRAVADEGDERAATIVNSPGRLGIDRATSRAACKSGSCYRQGRADVPVHAGRAAGSSRRAAAVGGIRTVPRRRARARAGCRRVPLPRARRRPSPVPVPPGSAGELGSRDQAGRCGLVAARAVARSHGSSAAATASSGSVGGGRASARRRSRRRPGPAQGPGGRRGVCSGWPRVLIPATATPSVVTA